jgi:uncharacterized membrane protein YeaQ/YmgE (transglycosylase-associated protein family)
MDIITWLIVGLIAGLLATAVSRGGGFGILGDILLGIVGAFVGGWGFHALDVRSPIDGLPGVILIATIGAIVVLSAIRLVQRSRRLRA